MPSTNDCGEAVSAVAVNAIAEAATRTACIARARFIKRRSNVLSFTLIAPD
jgi:hypothetical protein